MKNIKLDLVGEVVAVLSISIPDKWNLWGTLKPYAHYINAPGGESHLDISVFSAVNELTAESLERVRTLNENRAYWFLRDCESNDITTVKLYM